MLIFMYKLTVAVLTYNRAHYLKKMLDSIQNQSYKDFYVIIYDNCSNDNTTKTVKPYLSDSRFSYYRHPVSIGRNNINYAIENCETEYLLISHDDDIMLPDMIKEELYILENNKNVSLVSTEINYIDINDSIIKYSVIKSIFNYYTDIIKSRDYINIFINIGYIINCPTVMFRMSILNINNLKFRSDIGGACDIYLWLELNQLNYNFYFIRKALYNYRLHNDQDSKNTLFMIPLLKKPIYYLLIKFNYNLHTIFSWLHFVNNRIICLIKGQENKIIAYRSIRPFIYLNNFYDLIFIIRIYYLLYVPNYIKKYLLHLKKCLKRLYL